LNKADRDLAAELQEYMVRVKHYVDEALAHNVVGGWAETQRNVSSAKQMLTQIWIALDRKVKEEK
jgi:hypothetical protein